MSSYFQLFVLGCIIGLYYCSHVFRYYFKFFIYYVVIMFNSVILIPYMLTKPCDVKHLVLAATFCRPISNLIGLKWTLRGREHMEKERACIIVANHQSSLDVLGMLDIWDVMDKCTVVAKRELFYAWPFGLAAWLCGLVFIDRRHGEKSKNTINGVANHLKENKIKLWIYPEGTRRNTNEIHPFKKGAFHLAIAEQLPILPVVFSSYRNFLDDKNKIFSNGEVIITTLPAISTDGLTVADVEILMERTRKIMSEIYKVTTEEAKANLIKNSEPLSMLNSIKKNSNFATDENERKITEMDIKQEDSIKDEIVKQQEQMIKTIKAQ